MKLNTKKLLFLFVTFVTLMLVACSNNKTPNNNSIKSEETTKAKSQAEIDAEKAADIFIKKIKSTLKNPSSMRIAEDITVENAEVVTVIFYCENSLGNTSNTEAAAIVDIRKGTCSYYIEGYGDDLANSIIKLQIENRQLEIIDAQLKDMKNGIYDSYPTITLDKNLFNKK